MDSRPILVLSPHMDDAMLSASAIVLQRECEVWTVFTGRPVPPQTTSWDLSCGFPDSDATINARKAEDAAAFEDTSARTRHLDFLEGAYATREQHRAALPLIDAEIDAWLRDHPTGVLVIPACAGLHMPPPVWEPLLRRVRRSARGADHQTVPTSGASDVTSAEPAAAREDAAGHTPGSQPRVSLLRRMMALPVGPARSMAQKALHAEYTRRRRATMGADGLAANPDHIALRDVALSVARRHPHATVVLFEDLPYLWHARGDAEVARLEDSQTLNTQQFVVPVDRGRKHAHLSCYTSQLPVLDGRGRLLEASSLPTAESYWLVAFDA